MKPNLASKLSLAVSQTIAPLICQSIPPPTAPKNVAKCRDLSHISRFSKTNPNPRRTELKARQHSAIALLYRGNSIAQIARTLGINPRTIFRWLKHPQFRAAMSQSAPVFRLSARQLMDAQSRAFDRALGFLAKSRGMSRNVAVFPESQNEPTVDSAPHDPFLHPHPSQLNSSSP